MGSLKRPGGRQAATSDPTDPTLRPARFVTRETASLDRSGARAHLAEIDTPFGSRPTARARISATRNPIASRLLREPLARFPPVLWGSRPHTEAKCTGVRMLAKPESSHFVSREKRLPRRQTPSASRFLVPISNRGPHSSRMKKRRGALAPKNAPTIAPMFTIQRYSHVHRRNPVDRERSVRPCERQGKSIDQWPQHRLAQEHRLQVGRRPRCPPHRRGLSPSLPRSGAGLYGRPPSAAF